LKAKIAIINIQVFSFEIMMKKNTILLVGALILGAFLFVNISRAADISIPVVNAFSVPANSASLTVPILSFVATDDVAVTGYFVSESSLAPAVSDGAWIPVAPSAYVFASAGSKTLHAWAKDAAGNISLSLSANVTVNVVADAVAPATPISLAVQ
jgi:hypothetical protein